MSLYEEQIAIEEASEALARDKYHKELTDAITQGRFDDTQEGQNLIQIMFEPLNTKIKEYLGTTFRGHTNKTKKYIELLSGNSDEISFVILKTLVKDISKNNNKLKITLLATHIISELKRLHFFSRLKKDNPKLHAYLGNEYKRASARRKEELIEKHIKSLYKEAEDSYSTPQDLKAGVQLIEVLLASGIDLLEKRLSMSGRNKSTYFLSLNDRALELLSSSLLGKSKPMTLPPMIVPPKDWTTLHDGGFLNVRFPFVKTRRKKDLRYLERQDFSKVFPIINKLQKTSWRINKRVADIIYDVFTDNMIDPTTPKSLPRLYGELPTSSPPTVEEIVGSKHYNPDATDKEKEEWFIWNKEREKVKIGLDGEVGRRLQFLLTMNLMQTMLDYDKFYYAYQLDYRGRVYPITDFLNPQSKGYTKSMLEFGEGQYLTDEGLYWLKIHTANCYGLDKEPFEKRIEWFDTNANNILDTCNEPLNNLNLWVDADSPYEYLATCYAYKDYMEGKKVHLPIQLDAVNSGLQFYSGLLRDKEGASSCCVIGNERSDLYQLIADRVNTKLETGKYPKVLHFKDSSGEERTVPTRVEANSLKGKVTRKMTKRNIMTIPYSVTIRGMQDQNWSVMEDMKLSGKDFWKGDEWVVNKLLTYLVYESATEIVGGATLGQQYLRDIATNLTKSARWFTPIYKFPVEQKATKTREVRVKTPLGVLMMRLPTDKHSKQKELSSIAANFIHSIDSTLLLYCVDNMSDDIGVIHDCFLVHPNKGGEIREHYKEGYISIMKEDPLSLVSKDVDPEGIVEVPCIGTLDLDEVRYSKYIIS